VARLAAEAVRRSGIRSGALRLNWSRGSGGRGLEPPWRTRPAPEIDPPVGGHGRGDPGAPSPAPAPAAAAAGCGRFWLQLSAATPLFTPLQVIISPTERRCATSLLSQIKTFAYGPSIQARRQARAAGAEDALLTSTAGGLCCGTVANLLVRWRGRWLTPPLHSGCLPGVMRRRALALDLVAEAEMPIATAWLRDGSVSAALLLNSLGCRPISHCDQVPLQPTTPAEAEAFWRSLL
jgi:branched-subunit amino acid aminotransferase/4-amino-4-deoxychorismate lyase